MLQALDDSIEKNKKMFEGELLYHWDATHQKQLLIVTSWRSGSTFLTNIVSHHPITFIHYEPLIMMGRNDVNQKEAIEHLSSLLRCK